MPRPVRVALAVGVLALPPPLLHAALASAAGSLFEALPFVLAAALLPGGRWRAFAPLAACGCGGTLPSALALPAIALCWLTFGPWPTLARASAGVAIAVRQVRRSEDVAATDRHGTPGLDPLAELERIALASFAAAIVTGALAYAGPAQALGWVGTAGSWANGAWPALGVPEVLALALRTGELALGAAAGALAPCGTAGIAAAAALRSVSPAAAAGLLMTSGLCGPALRPALEPAAATRAARPAYGALAIVAVWFAAGGEGGFINPRLFALAPLGAVLAALAFARRPRTRLRLPGLVPAAMALALVLGSPPPGDDVATLPLDLYPGRAVVFTGQLAREHNALTRAAILCCRADAQRLRLELEGTLPYASGTWLEVRGRAARSGARLRLHVESARHVAAPRDPFAYL